jgi:hypothetical protein
MKALLVNWHERMRRNAKATAEKVKQDKKAEASKPLAKKAEARHVKAAA